MRDASRIADIRILLAFYLAKHERSLKKKTMGLTPAAFRALLQFSWPGNVRQLNNVCLTLVTHAAPGSWIDVTDIQRLRPDILTGPKNPNPEAFLEDENVTYGDAVRAFRKKLILDRLRRHGNNVWLGVVLSLALGLELLFLTLSVGASFRHEGGSRLTTLAVTSGISLLLLVGALVGMLLLRGASSSVLAAILSFGAAALLYFVTEELLVETRLPEETLMSTAMFFLGFVAIFALVLAG